MQPFSLQKGRVSNKISTTIRIKMRRRTPPDKNKFRAQRARWEVIKIVAFKKHHVSKSVGRILFSDLVTHPHLGSVQLGIVILKWIEKQKGINIITVDRKKHYIEIKILSKFQNIYIDEGDTIKGKYGQMARDYQGFYPDKGARVQFKSGGMIFDKNNYFPSGNKAKVLIELWNNKQVIINGKPSRSGKRIHLTQLAGLIARTGETRVAKSIVDSIDRICWEKFIPVSTNSNNKGVLLVERRIT